jgi:hypothetical protein
VVDILSKKLKWQKKEKETSLTWLVLYAKVKTMLVRKTSLIIRNGWSSTNFAQFAKR